MKLGQLRQLAQAVGNLEGEALQQGLQDMIRKMGMDPHNIYQELEMTSRFVDTHRDTSYSNSHLQLHSHTFYELLYCRTTCGAQYLMGSERYQLQRGDIVFVPPGISHRPLLPEHMTQPYERYVLWLSQEFLDRFADISFHSVSKNRSTAGVLRTGGETGEALRQLFRTGVEEAEGQADGWETAVIGNTLMLLSQIKRATNIYALQPMAAEKPLLLDRITAYIEDHYTQKLTVEGLAQEFYVSASTVSHLFKEKMGVSLYRYATQRRLIAAKTLIEKGVPLEAVGGRIGFTDYSGFYRAFKQEYGISPRQYKLRQGVLDD